MAAPMTDYVALRDLQDPRNPLLRFKNAGDPVAAGAVENLGFEVGVDVAPARSGLLPRPEANAKRAEWESYAIHEGVPAEEAKELTRDELIKRVPEKDPAEPSGMRLLGEPFKAEPERVEGRDFYRTPDGKEVDYPAATAPVKEWRAWVVEHRGVGEKEASALSRTDIQAQYGPNPKLS